MLVAVAKEDSSWEGPQSGPPASRLIFGCKLQFTQGVVLNIGLKLKFCVHTSAFSLLCFE